jgi:hypothetical protein
MCGRSARIEGEGIKRGPIVPSLPIGPDGGTISLGKGTRPKNPARPAALSSVLLADSGLLTRQTRKLLRCRSPLSCVVCRRHCRCQAHKPRRCRVPLSPSPSVSLPNPQATLMPCTVVACCRSPSMPCPLPNPQAASMPFAVVTVAVSAVARPASCICGIIMSLGEGRVKSCRSGDSRRPGWSRSEF